MNMKKHTFYTVALGAALCVPAIVIPATTEATTPSFFTDVSVSNDYYEVVHVMQSQGIISGYADGTFKPQQTLNRKQMAALLNRAMTLPKTTSATQPNDVTKNNPYSNDLLAIQQAGIFTLDKNGNIHPNRAVTRSEMAKALVLAFQLTGSTNKRFADVPKNHANERYIQTLYANGLTNGNNGQFLPDQKLTRMHYAVFMYRVMATIPLDKTRITYTNPFFSTDYSTRDLEDFILIKHMAGESAAYDLVHPFYENVGYKERPFYYFNHLRDQEYYYSPWVAKKLDLQKIFSVKPVADIKQYYKELTGEADDTYPKKVSIYAEKLNDTGHVNVLHLLATHEQKDVLEKVIAYTVDRDAQEIMQWIEATKKVFYNPYYHSGDRLAKQFGDYVVHFRSEPRLQKDFVFSSTVAVNEALFDKHSTISVWITHVDTFTPILNQNYQPIQHDPQKLARYQAQYLKRFFEIYDTPLDWRLN